MTNKEDVVLSLPSEDKEKFEEILHNNALTISDAFRLFVRKVINDKALPFEITDDLTGDEEDLIDEDEIWL